MLQSGDTSVKDGTSYPLLFVRLLSIRLVNIAFVSLYSTNSSEYINEIRLACSMLQVTIRMVMSFCTSCISSSMCMVAMGSRTEVGPSIRSMSGFMAMARTIYNAVADYPRRRCPSCSVYPSPRPTMQRYANKALCNF